MGQYSLLAFFFFFNPLKITNLTHFNYVSTNNNCGMRFYTNFSRNMVAWAESTFGHRPRTCQEMDSCPKITSLSSTLRICIAGELGQIKCEGKRPKYSGSKTKFDPFWQHKQGFCTEVHQNWEGSQKTLYCLLS